MKSHLRIHVLRHSHLIVVQSFLFLLNEETVTHGNISHNDLILIKVKILIAEYKMHLILGITLVEIYIYRIHITMFSSEPYFYGIAGPLLRRGSIVFRSCRIERIPVDLTHSHDVSILFPLY